MFRKMRGYGLAAVAIALGAVAGSPVQAQSQSPMWTWSGFYAGVNVGWGFGEKSGDLADMAGYGAAVADGRVLRTLGLRPDGVIGGGQIGYNWQSNAAVYGIEADLQASGMKDRTAVVAPATFPILPSETSAEDRLKWFGTFRGRFGFTPAERSLLYLTGGLAFGRVADNASVGFLFPGGGYDGYAASARSQTKAGWTLGGGGEFAWTDNWSFKVEYLYVDLGSTVLRLEDTAVPGNFIDYRFEHRDHIVRVGVNYRPK